MPAFPTRKDLLATARARGADLLLAALLAFYAITVFRFAWVGDDAYITLRTVENLGRGYGLTWNTTERVQAYTHPLWMLVLVAGHLVTGELYYATISLCFLVSAATVLLFVFRAAPSRAAAAVGLAFLCGSRAFIDYSTSGLENPLTHLLIVAFFLAWRSPWPPARRLLALSTLTALAATNRMDTVLLFAPALLVELGRDRSRRGLAAVALGLAPFLAWEVFAVIYYGFPFPNTAYAKLSTGVSRAALARQGAVYIHDSLSNDPTTLLAILAAIASVLAQRRWRELPFVAGVVLYLAYVVSVGGDFMRGRFFTGPLMLAVILLARSFDLTARGAERGPLGPALQRIALAALTALAANLSGWLDGPIPKNLLTLIEIGVADERRFYHSRAGLETMLDGGGLMDRPPAVAGRPRVMVAYSIGFKGLLTGPSVHIVDVCALADPLLARLPTYPPWRVGHYERVVPFGYLETLETGEDHFVDRDLAALYERIEIVTRGPLFSRRRWTEIWRLNTRAYDHLVDKERYKKPRQIELAIADLPERVTLPMRWDAPGSVLLPVHGARIKLEQPSHAARLEVAVACGAHYRVALRLDKKVVATREVNARCIPRMMSVRVVKIEEEEAAQGYDEIVIDPIDNNGQASLAAISLE